MGLGQRQPSNSGAKRDNSGKLWENQRQDGPKSPAFTGVATVDGKDYRVSAWNNEDGTVAIKFRDKTEERRDNFDRSQMPREAPRRQERPSQYPPRAEYDDRPSPPTEVYEDEFDR